MTPTNARPPQGHDEMVRKFTFRTGNARYPIRALELDGQPWFVAADVCRVFTTCRASAALRCLPAAYRSTICLGHRQPAYLISERGLSLLATRARSRRAVAAQLHDWAIRVVLPAFRKAEQRLGLQATEPAPLTEEERTELAQVIRVPRDKDEPGTMTRQAIIKLLDITPDELSALWFPAHEQFEDCGLRRMPDGSLVWALRARGNVTIMAPALKHGAAVPDWLPHAQGDIAPVPWSILR